MSRNGRYWLSKASQLRRKINLAVWLELIAIPGVISAGVTAAAILLLRHYWPQLHPSWQWLISTLPILICGAASIAAARSRFIPLQAALIRLECRHQLNAALSTAHEGAGPWPPPSDHVHDGLHWSWSRASLPCLLMLALIFTAWSLPVKTPTKAASVISEPASWKLVENSLAKLIKNNLVDKSSTEPAQKAIEALRERPQEKWFDHSSIEAGDRIVESHQRELFELENNLRETARALRDLAELRKGIQSQGPPPDARYSDLLSELRMGGLKPDEELLKKLSELQGENGTPLNQLDIRQLADLLDQVEGNARKLSEMLGQMQGNQASGEQPGQNAQQPGFGQNGDQLGPIQGEPPRGPGQGGALEGEPKDLELDPLQNAPLQAGDTSRSLPGDFLGEGEAKHHVDTNHSPTLSTGGAASQPGDGGSAVWRESLHPSEQEALKRFFE